MGRPRLAAALLLLLVTAVPTDMGRTAAGRMLGGLGYDVVPGRFLLSDLMSSWWTLPKAAMVDGMIHVGGVEADGSIVVASFDSATGVVTRSTLASYEQDDHNAPAILIPDDHPPIAFYARHGLDAVVRYRSGSTVGSFDSLGAEDTISFSGNVTYAQVYRRPATDELHLFTRIVSSGVSRIWSHKFSTDWGGTWSTQRNVFDFGSGNQGYIVTAQTQADGDVLRVAAIGHPVNSSIHDVYVALIDLGSGEITKLDGTSLGNLKTGSSLPIVVATELDKAVDTDTAGSHNARLFDVSDGATWEIAYQDWTNDTNAEYRVASLSGASFGVESLVAAGVVFGFTPSSHYNGGMAFPRNAPGGRVYLAREDDGTWYLEDWQDGGGWSGAEIASSSDILSRPHPVTGGEVVWLGIREYSDYETWDGDTIGLR